MLTAGQKLGLLLVCLAAILSLSLPSVRLWDYENESFQPVSIRANLLPSASPREADLDQDGSPECLRLQDGQASLIMSSCTAALEEAEIAWQSPPEWQVVQAHLSDLNRDHIPEISLLVWREFQPWFIDRYIPHPGRIDSFHNEQNQSCHVILIGWRRGKYGELWAGSAMADPLLAFFPADLDGDGWNELAALESRYADTAGQPAQSLTAWEWNGFGFTLLARQDGAYRAMQILTAADGRNLILTSR